MNKKIEELARYMCLDCAKDSYCSLAQVGGLCNSVRKQAAAIYEAGYRKQTEGEWIDAAIEQIIRKKAEVSEYWQNDVKQYRATQGYSDIEHDVDNFLRGYGEAIEDIIKILDGAKMKGGE